MQCASCGAFDGHESWCTFAPRMGTTTGNESKVIQLVQSYDALSAQLLALLSASQERERVNLQTIAELLGTIKAQQAELVELRRLRHDTV